MNVAIVISILILAKTGARAYNMRVPLYNRRLLSVPSRLQVTNLALRLIQNPCNVLKECPGHQIESTSNIEKNSQSVSQDNLNSGNKKIGQIMPIVDQSPFRRTMDQIINANMIPLPYGKLKYNKFPSQNTELRSPFIKSNKLNLKLGSLRAKQSKVELTTEPSQDILSSTNSTQAKLKDVEVTTTSIDVQSTTVENSLLDLSIAQKFLRSLDTFDQKFYATTFRKLSLVTPPARRENGMSYVQSGLFLQLALMALSTEVDPETKREIDDCLEMDISDQDRLDLINTTVSSLPTSSDDLKFLWSSRLVLRSQEVSDQFRAGAASALRLQIDSFNGTETPKEMADSLNHMVEVDSGGAIHNTFEEEEVSSEVRAVLVSTLYLRARWRSAPTLLNGTRAFRDPGGPRRASRMIRLNDHMRYASLDHWDAEALEIFYSTPGLSLLMLVPRGGSLRALAAAAGNSTLGDILAQMQLLRVAATLPLYTLRMTLLLPNKLQEMNVTRLLEVNNASASGLRLSLAVQRIMFWAEAGRNAFKDDGLEWDEPPQRELIVDRPYIFYVRWKNTTIMNGNFVL